MHDINCSVSRLVYINIIVIHTIYDCGRFSVAITSPMVVVSIVYGVITTFALKITELAIVAELHQKKQIVRVNNCLTAVVNYFGELVRHTHNI